jgi:hypothetical protein
VVGGVAASEVPGPAAEAPRAGASALGSDPPACGPGGASGPCSPPAGSEGMAAAGPYRRPRHFQVEASAAPRPGSCPWPGSGPPAPPALPSAVGGEAHGGPAVPDGLEAAWVVGASEEAEVVETSRGAAGVGASVPVGGPVFGPPAGPGGSRSPGSAAPPRPGEGAPGPGRAIQLGSVVTRCHSSTISNGRCTIAYGWLVGTPAGSSCGSRTSTRRPSKRDLTRSMACLRREGGRSMTTASMPSAGMSDQAWTFWSSVTRPVP